MFNILIKIYVHTMSFLQRIIICINRFFLIEKSIIKVETEKFNVITFSDLIGDPSASIVPFYFPSKPPITDYSFVYRIVQKLTIVLNYYTPYLYHPAPTDQEKFINTFWTFLYRLAGIPKPILSPIFKHDYLALFLTEGPLYYLLEKNHAENSYVVDFTALSTGEFKDGVYPYGGKVYLNKRSNDEFYHVEKAFYNNKLYYPTDPFWKTVYDIMISNCIFINTLLDHFGTLHSLIGNHFALATMNNLPPNHLLRLFLEPHIKYTTGFDYGISSLGFIGTNAFFHQDYPYKDITHVYKQIESYCKRFNFTKTNPRNHLFVSNKLKINILSLYEAVNNYVTNGINLAYPNINIMSDPYLIKFIKNLNDLIPNGIGCSGQTQIIKSDLIEILSTFLYLIIVKHPADSTILYDALSHFLLMPSSIQMNPKPLSYMFSNFKMGLVVLLFQGGKNNLLDQVHSYVNTNHELSNITREFIMDLNRIEHMIEQNPSILPIYPSELYASVSY
jgi:hypothetical protein